MMVLIGSLFISQVKKYVCNKAAFQNTIKDFTNILYDCDLQKWNG
jgi:hypothetical protein